MPILALALIVWAHLSSPAAAAPTPRRRPLLPVLDDATDRRTYDQRLADARLTYGVFAVNESVTFGGAGEVVSRMFTVVSPNASFVVNA